MKWIFISAVPMLLLGCMGPMTDPARVSVPLRIHNLTGEAVTGRIEGSMLGESTFTIQPAEEYSTLVNAVLANDRLVVNLQSQAGLTARRSVSVKQEGDASTAVPVSLAVDTLNSRALRIRVETPSGANPEPR